ncbi:MAG: PAS domain S-box protein [Mariprofundales bacterium]
MMTKILHRSLYRELLVLFLVLLSGGILAVGYFSLMHVEKFAYKKNVSSLENIADEKATAINRYVDEHLTRIKILSQRKQIAEAMSAIDIHYQQFGIKHKSYLDIKHFYSTVFTEYIAQWSYYDLFLINPAGDIVYSVKNAKDFGTNLYNGAYKDSGLARAFKNANTLLQANNSSFSYYPPSQAPAAFLAAPIVRNNILLGVIALQFDTNHFYEIVTDISSLGISGETVIGRLRHSLPKLDNTQDKMQIEIAAPLRHDLDAAFHRRIAKNAKNALPIRESSAGLHGNGTYIDWRDEEVLAVWQYIPAMQWGMVVKIDTVEVFAHMQSIRHSIITFTALALLLGYIMALVLLRRLRNPLEAVTNTSLAFAAGNRNARVPIAGIVADEIGLLATSFNDMAEELQTFEQQQQHTIEDRNEHLRAVASSSTDAMFTTDDQAVIQTANVAAGHLFACTSEELLQRNIWSILEESAAKQCQGWVEHYKIYGQWPMPYNVNETTAITLDGSYTLAIELSISAMQLRHRNMFLIVMRDISWRKDLENEQKRLMFAINQAQDSVVITDANAIIVYINPAFEKLSGYNNNELIGNNINIVKSGGMSNEYYQKLWQFLSTGNRWHGEFINKRKDGSIYHVEQTISPMIDKDNTITGFASVQRDITDRKRTQQEMEHKQRLESLGVLAGGIAHDFNNLLAVILGNTSLVRMELNDKQSDLDEYMAHVETATNSAAELCTQMLAYAGKGRFVVRPINISVLVKDMMDLLNVSIAKHVHLDVKLANNLPSTDGDASQLKQVIMNLIINASEAINQHVTYEDEGYVQVETSYLKLQTNEQDSLNFQELWSTGNYYGEPMGTEFVMLQVCDNGIGMDEVTCKRIFDPFFTTKFTGRGLGMSAVLGIIRSHKGAIHISSTVNLGTTFHVLFPISEHEEVINHAIPIVKQLVSDNKNKQATLLTILIVDDEYYIRDVAKRMLQRIGHKVLQAEEGLQAIQILEKERNIDCVLLDMTMPGMDGVQTLHYMRRIKPDLRIILSSGYSEQEAMRQFPGNELVDIPNAFLQKPYTPKKLAACVEQVNND